MNQYIESLFSIWEILMYTPIILFPAGIFCIILGFKKSNKKLLWFGVSALLVAFVCGILFIPVFFSALTNA